MYRLLSPSCTVLRCLGKSIPFEVAVGSNGLVWINSASNKHTILIANAILNSVHVPPSHVEALVNQMVASIK